MIRRVLGQTNKNAEYKSAVACRLHRLYAALLFMDLFSVALFSLTLSGLEKGLYEEAKGLSTALYVVHVYLQFQMLDLFKNGLDNKKNQPVAAASLVKDAFGFAASLIEDAFEYIWRKPVNEGNNQSHIVTGLSPDPSSYE
jgi:hypothetical protein